MSTHVSVLSDLEVAALRERLRSGCFEERTVPHALFSLKGEGVTFTAYLSGKCVVQGPGLEQFLAHYLPTVEEERQTQLFANELTPEQSGLSVGSDESGKGDYFGPLVVAAVGWGPQYAHAFEGMLLGDSKKISATSIKRTAAAIREHLPHAVVVLGPERYNALYAKIGNLNHLLAWAHGTAIEEVLERCDADLVIVDKFCNEATLRRGFKVRTKSKELLLRTRAESHPAVGAASILASDVFWRELDRLGRKIGLTLPKGAGPPVDATARRLLKTQGLEGLSRVAKMHFKTTQKVTGS